MYIVCCVKQVPDTTQIKIDPVTNTLIRADVESICNPYDLSATEVAVRLVERYSGKVSVITMGIPPAEVRLRECLSLDVLCVIEIALYKWNKVVKAKVGRSKSWFNQIPILKATSLAVIPASKHLSLRAPIRFSPRSSLKCSLTASITCLHDECNGLSFSTSTPIYFQE